MLRLWRGSPGHGWSERTRAGRLPEPGGDRSGGPFQGLQEAARRAVPLEALRRHGEAERGHHRPACAPKRHRDRADAPAPFLLVDSVAALSDEAELAGERRGIVYGGAGIAGES